MLDTADYVKQMALLLDLELKEEHCSGVVEKLCQNHSDRTTCK